MILPEASIIEIIPPLVVELVGIIFLMATAIKEIPDTRANSIARSFFLIPAMIAAAYLAGTGVDIVGMTTTTTTLEYSINGSTGAPLINTTSTIIQSSGMPIVNWPGWTLFHYMVFIVLLIFVVRQILIMATKSD